MRPYLEFCVYFSSLHLKKDKAELERGNRSDPESGTPFLSGKGTAFSGFKCRKKTTRRRYSRIRGLLQSPVKWKSRWSGSSCDRYNVQDGFMTAELSPKGHACYISTCIGRELNKLINFPPFAITDFGLHLYFPSIFCFLPESKDTFNPNTLY